MTAASFKALVTNPWFQFGRNLLGWVAVPLLGTLLTVAITLRNDVADNRSFSESRAEDSEAFQKQVLTNDTLVAAQVELLRSGQIAQGQDIATISGILQEMQRRDVAESKRPTYLPGTMSPR